MKRIGMPTVPTARLIKLVTQLACDTRSTALDRIEIAVMVVAGRALAQASPTPASALKSDPAQVQAQSGEIKARYAKLFRV